MKTLQALEFDPTLRERAPGVRALILDHYQNESQTLTQGAEANLLKFKEFEGIASEAEKHRWADIKKEFMKRRLLGGDGGIFGRYDIDAGVRAGSTVRLSWRRRRCCCWWGAWRR